MKMYPGNFLFCLLNFNLKIVFPHIFVLCFINFLWQACFLVLPQIVQIPGLGRCLGQKKGYTLQYSCLEISWTEEPDGLQSKESHKSQI